MFAAPWSSSFNPGSLKGKPLQVQAIGSFFENLVAAYLHHFLPTNLVLLTEQPLRVFINLDRLAPDAKSYLFRAAIDILICDRRLRLPVVGIDLQGLHHDQVDQQVRDRTKREVFNLARVPLLYAQVDSAAYLKIWLADNPGIFAEAHLPNNDKLNALVAWLVDRSAYESANLGSLLSPDPVPG